MLLINEYWQHLPVGLTGTEVADLLTFLCQHTGLVQFLWLWCGDSTDYLMKVPKNFFYHIKSFFKGSQTLHSQEESKWISVWSRKPRVGLASVWGQLFRFDSNLLCFHVSVWGLYLFPGLSLVCITLYKLGKLLSHSVIPGLTSWWQRIVDGHPLFISETVLTQVQWSGFKLQMWRLIFLLKH